MTWIINAGRWLVRVSLVILLTLAVLSVTGWLAAKTPAGRAVVTTVSTVWNGTTSVLASFFGVPVGGTTTATTPTPSATTTGGAVPMTTSSLEAMEYSVAQQEAAERAEREADQQRIEAMARRQAETDRLNLLMGSAQPGDSLVIAVYNRADRKPVEETLRLFIRDEKETREVILRPGKAQVLPAVRGRNYTCWAQQVGSIGQSSTASVEFQGPGLQQVDLWMGPASFGSTGISGGPATSGAGASPSPSPSPSGP